jgi:chromosome segregation ATPase
MDGEVKRLEGEVDEVRSQQQQQVLRWAVQRMLHWQLSLGRMQWQRAHVRMRKEADRIALEGVEERLATLQQTAEHRIHDLQSKLSGAENSAEALEGTVSDLNSRIAQLMEQLKQRDIEVNEVQASKDELEAMTTAIKQQQHDELTHSERRTAMPTREGQNESGLGHSCSGTTGLRLGGTESVRRIRINFVLSKLYG